MWQYLVNIWESVKTPLIGMRLTWKRLFVPAVTLQYPEERWELPPNSRMQLFVNMELSGGLVRRRNEDSALVIGFSRAVLPIAIYVANFFIVH